MELFTELSDRLSEQISGGKNDQWQSPGDGTEQVVPPGLYKNNQETGFVPPGLSDGGTNTPIHGQKNGIAESDIGIVPRGWQK